MLYDNRIQKIYTLSEIMFNGLDVTFYAPFLTEFKRDFPKTITYFKDGDYGTYAAKFKGKDDLLKFLAAHKSFKEEYQNLSYWQQVFVGRGVSFLDDDLFNLCSKLDLNKTDKEIMRDAVNIVAHETHMELKQIIDYIREFGGRKKRKLSFSGKLAKKVAACLHT